MVSVLVQLGGLLFVCWLFWRLACAMGGVGSGGGGSNSAHHFGTAVRELIVAAITGTARLVGQALRGLAVVVFRYLMPGLGRGLHRLADLAAASAARRSDGSSGRPPRQRRTQGPERVSTVEFNRPLPPVGFDD